MSCINLVGENAVECCSSAVYFVDFLEKLFVFFTISTDRHQLLAEALKRNESLLSLKRFTTTRWSCGTEATKALKYDYQQIKDVLKKLLMTLEKKDVYAVR